MTSDERDFDDLAAGPVDDQDLATLAALRSIFEASDPVPAGMADRSKFVMSVAALEAEVASIVSASDLAGVRTTNYDRATTITFASGTLSAMVSIEPMTGGRVRLAGWVTGARVEVELRERSRTRVAVTDEEGRFGFDAVERGLAHFVLRPVDDPQGRPVITPAIEI